MLQAALAAPILAATLAGSPTRSLRYGVIGTGCIGIEHLRNLHLIDDAEVVAICDSHPASLSAGLDCLRSQGVAEGVKACSDYRELIAMPEVDAVIVCTPNDHHIHLMRELMPTRKHVLVEKPLTTKVGHCAEVEALHAAACDAAHARGETPPIYWCGMEYRYIPAVSRLVREAHSGMVGELRMLSIREHRFPFLQKASPRPSSTATPLDSIAVV